MSPRSEVKTAVPAVDTAQVGSPNTMPSISLRKPHDSSPEYKYATIVCDPGSSDSRFVLPKCRVPRPEEFLPVETFVADAIMGKSTDDPKSRQAYQAILDKLRKRDEPAILCKVLLAIRTAGKGSTLHQLTSSSSTRHAHLLHLLFRLDPFTPPVLKRNDDNVNSEPTPQEAEFLEPFRDYSLADAHLHLLLAIVSANSVYLNSALNALWRMVHLDLEDAPSDRTYRVHAAIATMIRLCPKGHTELFPIMASNFPFRTKPVGVLVWYTKQCLYSLEYVPTIQGQVLELIIDKCLEMDVEIKINHGGHVSIDHSSSAMDDQSDSDEIEEEEEVFPLDLDVNPVADESNVEEVVDEMADKLDSTMLLAFEHLDKEASRRPGAVQDLYHMVSPVFDASILTTHRSKFVQFLILFLCGIDADEADGMDLYRDFAAKLIDIVLDPYRATVTRQSGACYLASFVSRASYVCPETACEAISALLRWAEAYLESPNGYATRSASDVHDQCELHSLFYTVCQSAFYMMCFRGAEAMNYYRSARDYHSKNTMHANDPNEDCPYADVEHVDIGPERWNKICGHELQPLRFCLESVRGEFLHIAEVFQLLETNLLIRLCTDDARMSTGHHRQAKAALICTAATLVKRRMKGGVGGLGRGSNPLDSFFPFDPYLLRRSFRFIEPMYKNWEGSVEEDEYMGLDDADDEDDVSEDASDSSSISDDEDDDKSRGAHMAESVDSTAFLQPMSHASSTTNASQSTKSSYHYGSPDGVQPKQGVPREAWGDTLKRARAPSIENGSW